MGTLAMATTSPVCEAPDGRRAPRLQTEEEEVVVARGLAGQGAKTGVAEATEDAIRWAKEDFVSASTDIDDTAEDSQDDSNSEDDESFCRPPTSPESHAADRSAAQDFLEAARVEEGLAAEMQQVGQEGLVAALANVLSHLASLGCKVHRATIFHAVQPPQISIQDYLTRIARYYHCSDSCLILGLIYIDRLVKLHPDFVVSPLNIHRLLSTSIMLASKFHDDVFYSNKYYGKVAGVRISELNRLEEKFLQMLKWRLFVSPDEYEEYLGRVLLPVRA